MYVHVRVLWSIYLHHPVDIREVKASVMKQCKRKMRCVDAEEDRSMRVVVDQSNGVRVKQGNGGIAHSEKDAS